MTPGASSHQEDLLDRVLGPHPPCFALLHRPDAVGDRVEVLIGDVTEVPQLADLPLPARGNGGPRHELLALVPYRQLSERGFTCHDDGSPLLALTVCEQASYAARDALPRLPDTSIAVTGGGFDVADEAYATIVRDILAQEIGQGVGANFVIKRSFTAEVPGFTPHDAISLFRRLMTGERGAYWTFVVHTGKRVFVGATPERHVSLFDGTAVMNPISGTLRYPPDGPKLPDVMEFLADPKEIGELYMVVDEELKMMARITERGGRVVGPFLKEMATLAHTEYLIEGRTTHDMREILRETMFAPTVTGSPLKSACRVIHAYEPRGRGYYSGVAALISRDINGARSMDSVILLRTAQITDGHLDIAVGATLVRDSDPFSEVAETHAKARSLLGAFGIQEGRGPSARRAADLSSHPEVRSALAARNRDLAPFWLDRSTPHSSASAIPALAARRALIVDAEDTFTAMLGHQLRALGLDVEVCGYTEADLDGQHDLVVMGPGPGDPRDVSDPKIARLRVLLRRLLDGGTRFLAVCLNHQVLGLLLGFDAVRRARPNQGVRKDIDFFGRRVGMGFYNTFALTSGSDEVHCEGVGTVRVSRDLHTGQVHGLAGPRFRSMQFHPESVLSRHGMSVLSETVTALLPVTDEGKTEPVKL
jgi:phenazine biosynthesis protein phzE